MLVHSWGRWETFSVLIISSFPIIQTKMFNKDVFGFFCLMISEKDRCEYLPSITDVIFYNSEETDWSGGCASTCWRLLLKARVAMVIHGEPEVTSPRRYSCSSHMVLESTSKWKLGPSSAFYCRLFQLTSSLIAEYSHKNVRFHEVQHGWFLPCALNHTSTTGPPHWLI